MFPPLSASRKQGRNPTLVNNQMQNNIMNAIGPGVKLELSLPGGNVSTSDTSLQRFDLEMIEGVTQVPMYLSWKGLNVWSEFVVGFFSGTEASISGGEGVLE
ncbi:hypothetical protein IFM89_031770 [Coptis chinensis]|uniref:Uncharacterized protein n=1 Tax=Coptis chinensis TaxID=261450 RepID=A0A835H083_9MAGN|nr:hypothetical protein IFM89_031770 [Coptis chinensis]